MKTALIISVYKNTADLMRRFKICGATNKCFWLYNCDFEDGNSTKWLICKNTVEVRFNSLTQEDLGWQKKKALNNTIRTIDADYFIFIDGDCVLHPNFIENHKICSRR